MEQTTTKKQCPLKVGLSKQKGSKDFLGVIKKLGIYTLVLDAILLIGYMVFLIALFTTIETPDSNSVLADGTFKLIYTFLGHEIALANINRLITIMILFLIVGLSTFFVNVKKQGSLQYYDYHRWQAGNYFVKGVTCLLYLNFIGFIMRLLIATFVMFYAEGFGLFVFCKKYFADRKVKRQQRKALKEAQKENVEQQELNKKIRLQITGRVFKGFFVYLFIILMAVFVLIPFYWMVLTALKTYSQAKAIQPEFFLSFGELQWVNFKFVYSKLGFGTYIRNTIIVAIFSTTGTLITSILAAFAFSRIDFKGRDMLFSILLLTMMVPGEIYSITNFITVSNNPRGLGWVGSSTPSAVGYFAAMIVPFMTSVFYIFFLRQTFKQVPDSLYKSAKIDGCSDFKFLRRVMLPIARPTILTITILSIIGTWSAFVWPNLLVGIDPVGGKEYMLIAVALRRKSFVIETGTDPLPMFNLQIAAAAIVTVPLLIVFLLLRKYIIRGVGRSGTKG